jgi:hypothetical protein
MPEGTTGGTGPMAICGSAGTPGSTATGGSPEAELDR